MFSIQLELVLFLTIFHVSDCFRRIKDGAPLTTDKSYAVYLVKAPLSNKEYDTWLCGGALVSSLFIITSAACVDDVEYLYAIAGYRKYVTDDAIETNQCTKEKKKKVVYTCIPMKYEFQYDQLEKWSFIDIALVKVESPYDFNDNSYKLICSYIPSTIPVNYEAKYQAENTDAMVLGWGHTDLWRKPEDTSNYNQVDIRYASTLILDKTICKQHYSTFPNMDEVIDQFMICSLEKGNLNENGELVIENRLKLNGCGGKQVLMGTDGVPCTEEENKDDEDLDLDTDATRREEKKGKNHRSDHSNSTIVRARKSGICQNDHGGPLVTWVGAHEVLIGVASVFKVSSDSKCMGPYLYTSTQCNGAFLDCILDNSQMSDKKNRRAICDSPPVQRGYDTVERHISWRNHPAGPAENEVTNSQNQSALADIKDIYEKHTSINNINRTTAEDKFKELKKVSENQMFLMRPQRPLYS